MCVRDYPIYACGKELFPGPAPNREYPCGKNCKYWEVGRYQSDKYCMSPRCDVCIHRIQPKTAKWTDPPSVSQRDTDPRYSRYYDSYGVEPPVGSGGGDPSGYGGYGGGYGGGDPSGYGGYGGYGGGAGGGGGGQVDPGYGYGGGGYGGGDPSGYGGYGGGEPSGSGYGGGGGGVPPNPMPRPNPNPFAGDNPPPLPSWLRDDEEKKGSKKSKGKSHRRHR